MPSMTAFYAPVLCCAGYAGFAVVLPLRGTRSRMTWTMALASAATALWAGTVALASLQKLPASVPDLVLTIQSGAWLGVVMAALYRRTQVQHVWLGLALAVLAIATLTLVARAGLIDGIAVAGVRLDAPLVTIVMDILGLMLVENMLRNFGRDEFWSLKYLAIGLAAVLGFDLLSTLPQFLTHIEPVGLVDARPIILLCVLPLFVLTAVRDPSAQLRIHSSRQIVFHAATLIGAGIVLEGVALAAYYERTYGGDNATVISVILGFSIVVGALVAAASTSVRARVRAFISENFYSYKYDYRIQWTSFIRSLSSLETGGVSLRILRTLAETLESPGGVLWSASDGGHQFVPTAKWSGIAEPEPIGFDSAEIAALSSEGCVYYELGASAEDGLFKNWTEKFPDGWIVVPLRFRSELIAFVLINKPLRPRTLDWEDRNLIELVALQLAGYLVQDDMARALADAEQLHQFNKRFAFVVHDIKNSIGQLDLVLRNAERFGSNPDFQADMNSTLRNVVDKLQHLLVQLREKAAAVARDDMSVETTNFSDLVKDFVADKKALGIDVAAFADTEGLEVSVPNRQAIVDVLEHVFSNAYDASRGQPIELKVTRRGQRACVDVTDRGPGMTQEFINTQLFRPLKSTKAGGLGIGAYQAREIVHGVGGDLEVKSKIGLGTTVTLSLPLSIRNAEAKAS